MNIGKKIADARREKNLTQEQLAELLSVTRQSISRWESDASYPEMDKVVRLCEILGISSDYLLSDSTESTQGARERRSAVTRLLAGLKGKEVELDFFPGVSDMDLVGSKCVIIDFDGPWLTVEYSKKKNSGTKLISVAAIQSVKLVRKEQ